MIENRQIDKQQGQFVVKKIIKNLRDCHDDNMQGILLKSKSMCGSSAGFKHLKG